MGDNMKRKMILIILFLGLLFLFSYEKKEVLAVSDGGDYTKFSRITLCRGKLLANYSEEELKNNYYKTFINAPDGIGWSIKYINKRVKCNFVSETIASVHNTGSTPIKYKFQKVDTKVYKTSISSTGTIETKVKNKIKTFENGLDAALKIVDETSNVIEVKTTENFEIDIDPKTKVAMYLCGDGYLTTGFATLFWCKQPLISGAFEYFEITNIYPRIVKIGL